MSPHRRWNFEVTAQLPLNFDVSSIVCSFEVQWGSTISYFFKKKRKKKKHLQGGGHTRAWEGMEDWIGNKLEEHKIMGRRWRSGDEIQILQKRLKDKGKANKRVQKQNANKKEKKTCKTWKRRKWRQTKKDKWEEKRARGRDRKRTFSGSDGDKVETANRFVAPCCLIGPLLHYQPINLKTHPNRLPPAEISVS